MKKLFQIGIILLFFSLLVIVVMLTTNSFNKIFSHDKKQDHNTAIYNSFYQEDTLIRLF